MLLLFSCLCTPCSGKKENISILCNFNKCGHIFVFLANIITINQRTEKLQNTLNTFTSLTVHHQVKEFLSRNWFAFDDVIVTSQKMQFTEDKHLAAASPKVDDGSVKEEALYQVSSIFTFTLPRASRSWNCRECSPVHYLLLTGSPLAASSRMLNKAGLQQSCDWSVIFCC